MVNILPAFERSNFVSSGFNLSCFSLSLTFYKYIDKTNYVRKIYSKNSINKTIL